jgi:hypothetical protein
MISSGNQEKYYNAYNPHYYIFLVAKQSLQTSGQFFF